MLVESWWWRLHSSGNTGCDARAHVRFCAQERFFHRAHQPAWHSNRAQSTDPVLGGLLPQTRRNLAHSALSIGDPTRVSREHRIAGKFREAERNRAALPLSVASDCDNEWTVPGVE